jgi:hypothetical protein
VRYKAAVIWDLFWTPFDERFAGILARIKQHQEDFDSSLANVYSEEMIMHFNAMDDERLQNSLQREVLLGTRATAAKHMTGSLMMCSRLLGMLIPSQKWNYRACKDGLVRQIGLALSILQRGSDWLVLAADIGTGRVQSWLAEEIPYPSHGSIFAKNILVISGMHYIELEKTALILNLLLAKPGYGKTALSTRVIEDLQERIRNQGSSEATHDTSGYS